MSLLSNAGLTADDLLKMPDGKHHESVDGRLMQREPGARAAVVGGNLMFSLYNHVRQHKPGFVFGSRARNQCFPSGNLRRLATSFYPASRLSFEEIPIGHMLIVPDLAVEVVAPTDIQYDIDRKVAEYLEVGVKLFWVINPDTRVILIYRADGSISGVGDGGELDGESVVPGFRCAVADLFVF